MGYTNLDKYDCDFCYCPIEVDYKYIENEICDNWWFMLTNGIGQSVAMLGSAIEEMIKRYFFCCKQALKERL